jgi:hypothetical protein
VIEGKDTKCVTLQFGHRRYIISGSATKKTMFASEQHVVRNYAEVRQRSSKSFGLYKRRNRLLRAVDPQYDH